MVCNVQQCAYQKLELYRAHTPRPLCICAAFIVHGVVRARELQYSAVYTNLSDDLYWIPGNLCA